MPEKVKKRNGRMERFSRDKLLFSVHLSLAWNGINNPRLEEQVTDDVIRLLGKRRTVDTEDIEKAVCPALKRCKHHAVCDAYSLLWLHRKPVRVKAVRKRHGGQEPFSAEKLFKSVQNAFIDARVHDPLILERTVKEILAEVEKRHRGRGVETTEIRDVAELVLMRRKLGKVAKAYIKFRYV